MMNQSRLLRGVGMGLAVGLPLVFIAGVAVAQTDAPTSATSSAVFAPCLSSAAGGGLDSLTNQFGSLTSSWMSSAQNYARHIFAGLAGLELAWSGMQYLMKRRDLEDFLASVFLKFLTLMFFYLVMIQFAPQWVPQIISSFVQIGQGIGGGSSVPTLAGSSTLGTMLSPSAILSTGECLAGQVMQMPGPDGIAASIIAGFLGIVTWAMLIIAYMIMALTLALAIIEAYIVTGAGLVMLGFLGARWTSTWGEKYFGYAVSIGVKLMVVYLIVGLGQQIVTQQVVTAGTAIVQGALTLPSHSVPFSDYGKLCAVALIFAGLAWNVPKLASSFLNGQPGMGMGDLMAPAAMAGAAAAGAAGLAAAGAGAAGMAALKSLTSGAAGASGGAGGAGSAAADGLAALSSLTSGAGGAGGSGSASGLSGAASSSAGASGAGSSGGSSAGSSSSASPSNLTGGAAGSGSNASASPAAASAAPSSAGTSAGEATAADATTSDATAGSDGGVDGGAQGGDSPLAADVPSTDGSGSAAASPDAPLSPSASTSGSQPDTLPGVQSTGTENAIGGAPSAATAAQDAQDKPKPSALVNAAKTTGQAMQNTAKTATDVTRKIANQIEGHDGSVGGISIRLGHIED